MCGVKVSKIDLYSPCPHKSTSLLVKYRQSGDSSKTKSLIYKKKEKKEEERVR